ncbi:MAG: DUF3276 family protein [Bacteroidetes bacterium]|nr:DUF3276 family protein [Bacteroidota bacterium]
MEDYKNNDREEIFSKKIRAGKRTYFFDVKSTRANDFYITITESKKKMDSGMYVKHKIFLYKEDFNKFMDALNETVSHVKTELMPEYDFEEFSRSNESEEYGSDD